MAKPVIPQFFPGMFDWRERRQIDKIRRDRAALVAYIEKWEEKCARRAHENAVPRIHWTHIVWRPSWLRDYDGTTAWWWLMGPNAAALDRRDKLDMDKALRARFIRGEPWQAASEWVSHKPLRKVLAASWQHLDDIAARLATCHLTVRDVHDDRVSTWARREHFGKWVMEPPEMYRDLACDLSDALFSGPLALDRDDPLWAFTGSEGPAADTLRQEETAPGGTA